MLFLMSCNTLPKKEDVDLELNFPMCPDAVSRVMDNMSFDEDERVMASIWIEDLRDILKYMAFVEIEIQKYDVWKEQQK